jgi:hypothetical protein
MAGKLSPGNFGLLQHNRIYSGHRPITALDQLDANDPMPYRLATCECEHHWPRLPVVFFRPSACCRLLDLGGRGLRLLIDNQLCQLSQRSIGRYLFVQGLLKKRPSPAETHRFSPGAERAGRTLSSISM